MKKLLIIGQRYNPQSNSKIHGGLENVERNHVRLLSENFDVYFTTPNNSEELPWGTTIKSPYNSKFSNTHFSTRKHNDFLKNVIATISPDIIINHDDYNSGINNYLSKINIPSISFVHTNVNIVGGMPLISMINSYYDLGHSGGIVCSVSDKSNKDYLKFAKKSSKHIKNYDEHSTRIFKQFIHPVVAWNVPSFSTTTSDYYVSMGRLIRERKFHEMISIFLKNKSKLVLMFPAPKNEEQRDYLQELETLKAGHDNIEFVIDADHGNVMEILRTSKGNIIMVDESFGISAYEANLYGIPVILISKKADEHVLNETCSPGQEYGSLIKIPFTSLKKDTIINLDDYVGELTFERKNQISFKTYEYYSSESMKKDLMFLILSAMESRMNNVLNRPLSEFL